MDDVMYNNVLLEQILSNIKGIREVKRLCHVCHEWRIASQREERRRLSHPNYGHLYYLFPLETTVPADAQMTYDDKPFVLGSIDEIKEKIINYVKSEMSFIPKKIIMFNAKFTLPKEWRTALELNNLRRFMPEDCQMIHFDSSTIIGTSPVSMVPHSAGERLAGISHLLLQQYHDVDIDVYYNEEIYEKLKPNDSLKCILYFESSKDYDRRVNDVCLGTKCGKHMWDVMRDMKYQIAFGGTRVNAIDVTDNRVNTEADKPFAMITFSGANIDACSVVFQTGNAQSTYELLCDFKSKLGFNADDPKESITLAFAFCRIIPYRFSRYCHFENGEPSELIHKVFPKIQFIGTINVMNFGHNFWPGHESKSDSDSNYRTTHFDSTVIVLINIKKSAKFKPT